MMRHRMIAASLFAVSSLALVAAPTAAEGKRVLVCKTVTNKANNGTIIGAVGGGLLGHVIAGHGNKTEGTLIGAGVGAVAGHQIAKTKARKPRCHYEYR